MATTLVMYVPDATRLPELLVRFQPADTGPAPSAAPARRVLTSEFPVVVMVTVTVAGIDMLKDAVPEDLTGAGETESPVTAT